ncbi:MAG: Hsp70 family protein [Rhizobiaceae bacterium]
MTEIGIDLGTTNSLIAYFDGKEPVLIKNALGDYLTPSAVSLADDGSILTGRPALDRLLSHPERSVASFKRFMGTEHSVKMGGRKSFRAEELSAMILRALKEDAENVLGTKVQNAVISVPAYFNERQRMATMDAGKLAGLNVKRLVNEPTAAALAHGFGNAAEGKYLVFDLGGGTFDVSILDKYDDVMEITATTGDTRLGGNDFSNALEQLLLRKHNGGKPINGDKASVSLWRQADILKAALSKEQNASYSFAIGKETFEGDVSRADFEVECADLLQRLRTPTERAVRDSGTAPDAFNAIIMVGGATRMPMIRSMVARLFGRLPLVTIDPDTTVALGAAVQAGLINRTGALSDVVMTDVCPFSLGVATVDDAEARVQTLSISPIIERNAIVPISRNLYVSTAADYQTTLEVQVYQGESLRPHGNVKLGSLDIPVPRAKKGVEGIDIRFTYDANSILEVEVRVLSNNKVFRQFLNNGGGLSQSELQSRFKELEGLKLHPREQMDNAALIARGERLYEEARGELRDVIKGFLLQFEQEISDQTIRDVGAVRDDLSQKLDSIEASMNRFF